MILNIIISFFLQILSTVGAIVLFGVLISLCSRGFYSNFGSKQMVICHVTGFIGTPVHECAHALFCLIFGHKITRIKLFQIDSADGTLGYVEHSHNPKNLYQKIGNFFIGIAQIIVISALLSLFAYLLTPSILLDILSVAQDVASNYSVDNLFLSIYLIACSFFSGAVTWQWWIFIIIGAFFALHVTLSKADIQGAQNGLILFLLILFVIDVILGIVGNSILQSFNSVIFSISAVLNTFLILSLLLSFVTYLLSLLYKITLGRRFA